MIINRETDGVRSDGGHAEDGRVDWRGLFLEHSAGDVFEYSRRLKAGSNLTSEELAELFAERRAMREEAAGLIGDFASMLERGDAGAVDRFFREGAWTRFVDVKGFDGALAEMVKPHLEALDEKELNALEDAVARSLRELADDGRVDGARIVPALAAVFDRERSMRAVMRERKIGPWRRVALVALVVIFILVRAYFRMS